MKFLHPIKEVNVKLYVFYFLIISLEMFKFNLSLLINYCQSERRLFGKDNICKYLQQFAKFLFILFRFFLL